MFCDYKLREVHVTGGVLVEVAFYEGDYRDVVEDGEVVNRYVRSACLGIERFEPKAANEDELRAELNVKLLSVAEGRQPIPEQTVAP